MRRLFSVVALACLVLHPKELLAWSATGHMTVAQIAYNDLSPAAKDEVDRLIAVLAPFDPQVSHFVPAATWMDMSRGYDINIFNQLHYISLPYNPFGLSTTKPPSDQNVVWGIDNAVQTLKSDKSRDFQRALLLRMLIHFVGDIHQPLHTCERFSHYNPDGELGGNRFPVDISPKMWNRYHEMNPTDANPYLLKKPTNLHAIWDEIGLLYPFVDPLKPPQWSERIPQFAKEITARYPRSELPEARDTVPLNWAWESHRAAIKHVYDGIEEQEVLPDTYLEQIQDVGGRRIALAGYRLATLLNEIYAGP